MKVRPFIPTLILTFLCQGLFSQSFYFGADLSYINEMEACGAEYKVNGEAKDPYSIFKDQGCNLVRLRLWHTPSWYDQLNDGNRYGDLEDVAVSIARAKAQGMDVLLDFHLSDTWADPGNQVIPAAWAAVVDNQTVLGDSLYNYILATLTALGQQGLLPDIVQIGNETNKGILLSQETNDSGWTLNWNRNKFLFQKAADAIKAASGTFGSPIKIALHIANPFDVHWMIDQFVQRGFNDFDIIGISYYWEWHGAVSIAQTGLIIEALRTDFPGKEVMIFETAYGWTSQNADAANNLLFKAHPSYAPLSPANQKKWMTDLTQTVIEYGGKGVIYWEPGWVSTGCSTPWVTGSSWDNATFFDFDNELMEDGGIGWMTYPYTFTSTPPVPVMPERLELTYAEGEIKIRNVSRLQLSFPCTMILHAADGKVVLSQKIASADEQMIGIPASGLLPGCYIVSLQDKVSAPMSEMICICK
jgi:arabinogalactan endo-1,4-beta-galactosidase